LEIAQNPAGSSANGNVAGPLAAIKSDPFILSMFFSLLLIGGDVIAVRVGGLTLRVVFPLLMVSFAFLFQRAGGQIAFDRILIFLFFLLALTGAASVGVSLDPVKSIGYTIWVFFDFFVIITLTYNFAKLYPAEVTLDVWFLVYRIHAVLLLLELLRNVVFLHSLDRPRLWFYETSFLAIFMAGYFGSALFMLLRCGKHYRLDFFLSLFAMVALTSATALFALLFAVLLNFIVARQRLVLLLATVVLLAIFFTVLYLLFRDTIYYRLAGGFLLNGDGLAAILERSGNRWIRAVVGWNAFLSHPWLGVGIGGDTAYMGASPFPDSVAGYLRPEMELDQGQPFSNILIEVVGTMGVAGLVPVLGILIYAGVCVIRSLRCVETPAAAAFLMAFFAIFLALQFDSTFLRYYLWTPLGLGLGALARMQDAAAPKFLRSPSSFVNPALP
jgi:hypothetical protein